jgi:hypothetical protein
MRVRLAPIRRLHVARAVGKMNLNCQPPCFSSGDSTRTAMRIQFWIANGFHFHRLAVEFEMADNFAVPQIQRLLDVRQIIRLRQRAVGVFEDETDLAEVQPVRIGAQPFDFRRLLVVRHVGIRHERPFRSGILPSAS